MLGYGCPFKNAPCYAQADRVWRKNYCDSDTGCERCAKRPKNTGNKEIQRQNDNFKRVQSDTSFGWLLIIVVVGMVIISRFL